MVRAVLVAARHPSQPNRLDAYREVLNRKLTGDNIDARPPAMIRRAGLTAAVLNPGSTVRMQGASIVVGNLLEPAGDWHVPGAPLPDGSFALLRADDTFVELAADGVGSRTLWYALTDRELIASTSQRAIVTLLGSFEPNRGVLPWMLSSGTLGPLGGWDTRLKRVQPGERWIARAGACALPWSKPSARPIRAFRSTRIASVCVRPSPMRAAAGPSMPASGCSRCRAA